MSLQRTLEMNFNTELNRTHCLRVYDVREDVTGAEVAAVMDNIIAKNIFNTSYGELIGKVNARIVTKETEEITLV